MKSINYIQFILFTAIIIILISCDKKNLQEKNHDDSGNSSTYYKADTTYVTGPDLSQNLEQFDSTKIEHAIEALRDRDFKKGIILWSPIEGSLVKETILTFGYPDSETTNPYWTCAQWASKYSLKNSNFQVRDNGDRVYQNIAKTVATNPDGSFQLELKGKQEWGNHVRQKGESWPHLGLGQPVYPDIKIPIAQCENIYFSLDGIREYCWNYMKGVDFNPSIHTAHILVNLTIQNRNQNSSLHGKYYIIQIPCYDYRADFPSGINAYDIGGKEVVTGALMYGISGDKLWDGTFKDGKWHKIRKDILPLILEAWPVATKKSSPLEGADIKDFYLANVSIMWEISGIFDASMRFKNFSIKAVLAQ